MPHILHHLLHQPTHHPVPQPVHRRSLLRTAAALAAGAALPPWVQAATVSPPRARRQLVTDVLWGEPVVDPYRWMENPQDPDWLPFMRGQAAYAHSRLEALPLRKRLLARVAQLSGETLQVIEPRPAAGLVFFQQRAVGDTVYKLTVRRADGEQRMLADPASFAKQGSAASIDWWQPAPDGRHVVFGVSQGGSEAATGYIVEVASGRLLEDRLAAVPYAAPAWLPDSSGFFYNRFAGRAPSDPAYYADRSVWLHRVGRPQGADLRVMAQGIDASVPMTAQTSPEVQTGVNSEYVALLLRDGYVRNFALYLASRADVLAGKAAWRKVCGPQDGVSDFALSGPDLFLVATAGMPRGRLLQARAATATLAEAKMVFESPAAVLDELTANHHGVYVTLNDGGEQSLLQVRNDGTAMAVALPFTGWIQSIGVPQVASAVASTNASSTAPASAAVPDATLLRMGSWLEPGAVFAVDSSAATSQRVPLQPRPPIDLSPYETRRVLAQARDGTRVPISIIARKGSQGRPAPCLVHVYGAYQWPSQPVFDVRAVAFLEAGGVVATAHVRGGGEYGRAWHEAGRQTTKPNTWRDLIVCCETLVSQGWTAKGRIAIMGGSAGGIAVGRAMTERPDLFGAVISKVGMSNPLRAEFEPNGQPNVPEFGSVATREGFLALKAMDSLHAVRDGLRYPPILLSTGLNDARVAPHNAAKMAARMQAARPGAEVLLAVAFDSGHVANGLSKTQLDADYANDFAFVLAHTGPRKVRQPKT
jgi:prolyl oligopeptidase